VSETVEFGGWPRPPRWVWVVAGVAAVAVLAGVVVARHGPHHASSSRPATSPVHGPLIPAAGSAARWPSAEGACRVPVYLPRMHLARNHVPVHVAVLVGGTALREVTPGGALSRPLPGLPGQGRVVTKLVSGPGADTPLSTRSAAVTCGCTGSWLAPPTGSARPLSTCSAVRTMRGQ